MQVSWIYEKCVLEVLQQMRGPEGGVFNRDMPINRHRVSGAWINSIPRDRIVIENPVFDEMVHVGYIARNYEGSTSEQWHVTKNGLKALQDAGMDTKAGKLSRDDISWLTGTGRFAQ